MDENRQPENTDCRRKEYKSGVRKTVKWGVSFGSCLAMVISYTAWHSIPWAILHGIFSWGYVLYYAIRY